MTMRNRATDGRSSWRRAAGLLMACCVAAVVTAWGTLGATSGTGQVFAQAGGQAGGLGVFPNLSLGNLGQESASPSSQIKLQASYGTAQGQSLVAVTAAIEPNWAIYSVTQAAGGPIPTTITLSGPEGVKLNGSFTPNSPPKLSKEPVWPDLQIEKHSDQVVWTAPIELPEGFDGEITLTVKGLVCQTDGSCIPVNQKLVAKPGELSPPASQGAGADSAAVAEAGGEPFRNRRSKVQWTGSVSTAAAQPGQTVLLTISGSPDPGYHIYAAAADDSESRTNFVFTDKAGLRIGMPHPNQQPLEKTLLEDLPPVSYHEGAVTWTIPVEIDANTAEGRKSISGSIAYQACTDTSCLLPRALSFVAQFDVSSAADAASSPVALQFESASLGETMDAAATVDWVDPVAWTAPAATADTAAASGTADGAAGQTALSAAGEQPRQTAGSGALSLLIIALSAIGGGLILNLMPCVLPVVGLKIMSFASQAGESRRKVLTLNFAYTLGILAVFWALALLAILSTFSWGRELLGVTGQMGWGQQFQYFWFRYGVILLVFGLALSFLGVWEIPLPGFVGGRATQQLQQQEGFSGAFFKGVFTTILATPCSGPLLGPVFAYTLGESPLVIWLIFTAIGLGMALPYLLVAFFPPLIAYLPKPGAWMDTLKQILGFVLLATCVYLFTLFPDSDRVMVFASLISVWFGCWIVGRVPGWETAHKRLTAWAQGIVAIVALCWFSMWVTTPAPLVIAWEPYDEVRLQQLRAEGTPVLIDFTANWCITCQYNFKVAVNTEETGRLLEELNAVPMLADWSDHNDVIASKLQELNSNSIPLLAIYPGGTSIEPIVLRDLVSQADVSAALRQLAAGDWPREQLATASSRAVTTVSFAAP